MMRYVIVALSLMALPALAHEPYTGLRDPVTNGACCGGHDCAVLKIEPGVLEATDAGYRITLTAEQAGRINPVRRVALNTVVPWARIQTSFDGNYHLCIPNYPSPGMAVDAFCFWAPGDT